MSVRGKLIIRKSISSGEAVIAGSRGRQPTEDAALALIAAKAAKARLDTAVAAFAAGVSG